MPSKPVARMLWLRAFALGHDVLMASASFCLALLLRLSGTNVPMNWPEYIEASLLYGGLVGAIGFAVGMNRGVWRYASLPDLIGIVKTVTLALAFFIVLHFLVVRFELIPRSCVVIAWAFTIVLLAAPRAVYRIYRNSRDLRRKMEGGQIRAKKVLLVGANDNADLFLKALNEGTGGHFEVLAIIDERGRRTGRVIRGVPVVGGPEELPRLIDQYEDQGRRPEALILARSREEYQQHGSLERLIELASQQRLELLRLPNLLEMQSIDAGLNIRPIKLEDLLQRPVIRNDLSQIAEMIKNRRVLITGAGGSIGSELARQITELQPSSLVLVDANEFLLYTIESELAENKTSVPLRARLCNVRESGAIARLIQFEKPDIVFHAAALKHVPMVEMQPLEGIFTNAIGTRNVAEACVRANVRAMILISTDKAVNPANVMGATKRLAEMYCQSMDVDSAQTATRFVTVRFGNVLGSAGSVVPLFERQIKAGGPITVTHPEIERYFMTIPEACLLVLQAAAHALARGEQRGRIFVLDMGSPVKIVDLARNLIRLSGMRPDIDIRIVYTGLRPGEKLYEELFANRETLVETGVASVLAASPRPVEKTVIARIVDRLEEIVQKNDTASAMRLLQSTVSEYAPGPQAIQAMLKDGRALSPTEDEPDSSPSRTS